MEHLLPHVGIRRKRRQRVFSRLFKMNRCPRRKLSLRQIHSRHCPPYFHHLAQPMLVVRTRVELWHLRVGNHRLRILQKFLEPNRHAPRLRIGSQSARRILLRPSQLSRCRQNIRLAVLRHELLVARIRFAPRLPRMQICNDIHSRPVELIHAKRNRIAFRRSIRHRRKKHEHRIRRWPSPPAPHAHFHTRRESPHRILRGVQSLRRRCQYFLLSKHLHKLVVEFLRSPYWLGYFRRFCFCVDQTHICFHLVQQIRLRRQVSIGVNPAAQKFRPIARIFICLPPIRTILIRLRNDEWRREISFISFRFLSPFRPTQRIHPVRKQRKRIRPNSAIHICWKLDYVFGPYTPVQKSHYVRLPRNAVVHPRRQREHQVVQILVHEFFVEREFRRFISRLVRIPLPVFVPRVANLGVHFRHLRVEIPRRVCSLRKLIGNRRAMRQHAPFEWIRLALRFAFPNSHKTKKHSGQRNQTPSFHCKCLTVSFCPSS